MKKYSILIFSLLFLFPSLTFAKHKSFKVYLSMGGDEVYKDTFADGLRNGLRKSEDIVFVDSSEKAALIITVSLLQSKTEGGVTTGFDVAVAVNAHCTDPDLSILAGPNDLVDLVNRTAAELEESVFEPLREAAEK